MATIARAINEDVVHPLKLKVLLRKYRISRNELGQHVLYTAGRAAGRPISRSMLSDIVNWNQWPIQTPQDQLIGQIEAYLVDAGVPLTEVKTAWDEDPQAEFASIRKPIKGAPLNANQVSALTEDSDEPEIPENEMLTEQARQHFKLFKHPFIDDVQGPEDVYLSAEQRYIRESMYQAAKHGGFLAIVGESGSGKTTLRRDLLDRIRRTGEAIRAIQPQAFDKTRLTAAHICDAIIEDLAGGTLPSSLELKARLVKRLLTDSGRAGNAHVLIIEEAHDLHISTLKYLKRFWELEDGFKKLLAIILVGQSELGLRLDERRNPQAREVIRRCEVAVLQPLNGDLEDYLALKFKRVGAELDRVFDKAAFDAIRERLTFRLRNNSAVQSQLYPLIVHNVCIKAMNQAAELSEPRVTAELVKGV